MEWMSEEIRSILSKGGASLVRSPQQLALRRSHRADPASFEYPGPPRKTLDLLFR